MTTEHYTAKPLADSWCGLIEFDEARVEGPSEAPTLVVEGTADCTNMHVFLSPIVYVKCSEWWGIEVVGCLPSGICLTATEPYKVKIPLDDLIGSEGVEVIGASGTKQLALEGGCQSGSALEY